MINGIIQLRFILQTDVGLTENFLSNIELNNSNPIIIMSSLLRLLSVAGMTRTQVDEILEQDIDEILDGSYVAFPVESDGMGSGNNNPTEPVQNKVADFVEGERRINNFVNDPSKLENFIKQMVNKPNLAKAVFKAYLDSLEE